MKVSEYNVSGFKIKEFIVIGKWKMKLVLATPASENDLKNVGYLPPMNLEYLAGSVKGLPEVQVSIVDGNGEGLNTEDTADRIIQSDPDVVGISVTSADIRRALMLLTLIKVSKPRTTIIFGGHHATAFDHLLLSEVPLLDMAMRGEAEYSFPSFCQRILKGKDITHSPGLSFRSNGRIIRGIPQIIKDLDSIPFPNRSLIDDNRYWLGGIGIKLTRSFPLRLAAVISSRGCTHRCTFCSKLTRQHHEYRARSAENILQELLELYTNGYKFVCFIDENFTKDINRIIKICNAIISQDLRMRFMFQGTLHNLNQSVLNLMHQAGFDIAAVGVESGSDLQLKRYLKAANSLAIGDGVKRAKKAHMLVHGSFIAGGPGETEEDFEATRRFVQNVRPHSCTIYELAVYPQTALWEDLFGHSQARTVTDTRCRLVHTIDGCSDRESIDRRINEFWRSYIISWLSWKRIGEVKRLWSNNPTFRIMLNKVFKDTVKIFLQLVRGVQASR